MDSRTNRLCAGFFSLALVLFHLGCSDGRVDSEHPLDAVFDYTGERVLSDSVVIGDDPGEPLFAFVTDVAIGPDGRVYVVDVREATITILSARGDSLGRLGRRGQGPGEFAGPGYARFGTGDSLDVYDMGGKGNVVYAPDLTPTYSFRLASAGNNRYGGRAFRLPDGSVLGHYERPYNPRFDSAGIWLIPVNRSGKARGPSLAALPQNEMIVHFPDANTVNAMGRPFGREALFAHAPDGRLCYAWTGAFRIQCIQSRDKVDTLLSVDYTPIPVTESDKAWYKERFGDAPLLETASWPDTHPAFRNMTFDREGRLWIQQSTHLSSGDATIPWSVIDLERGTYATLRLPAHLRVANARGNYVYAISSGNSEPLVRIYTMSG